jgi:hypothetical protein
MTKIKFIASACGFGYGYMEGTELECSDAMAEEMVELGVAIKVKISPPKPAILPEDFPMRHVLVQYGIETLAELRNYSTVEMLTELKGIGRRSAEAILERLKEIDAK